MDLDGDYGLFRLPATAIPQNDLQLGWTQEEYSFFRTFSNSQSAKQNNWRWKRH
jgi:hypothetical protein